MKLAIGELVGVPIFTCTLGDLHPIIDSRELDCSPMKVQHAVGTIKMHSVLQLGP